MEDVTKVKALIAGFVAALTALWGWFGWLVIGWIGAMVLDYLTGSAAALKNGEWSSKVARDGLWHKAGAVSAVLLAALLDAVLGLLVARLGDAVPIHYTVLLYPLVTAWYILTEAGSIIENVGKMGAPVPDWLAKHIASLRDNVDHTAEKSGSGSD